MGIFLQFFVYSQYKKMFQIRLFSCAQIRGNEMDRACGTYEGEGKCVQNFGGDN